MMQQVSQKKNYRSAGLIITIVTELSWFGRGVYIRLRERAGEFLSMIPIAILYLFLKAILKLFLSILNDRNKNSALIIVDGFDYKFYKNLHDKLSIFLPTMKKVQAINFDKQNFLNRSLLRDVSRITRSGIAFHAKIDAKIKSLDLVHDGKHFKSIKESQLWNSRTKAYDYVL